LKRYLRRMLSVVLVLLPVALYATSSSLTSIRIIKMDAGARVVLFLTQPAELRHFIVENPKRLVMEFDQTKLIAHLRNLTFPTSDITSIRSGYPNTHVLRLVLTLNSATQYSILPIEKSNRYVVDITRGKVVPPVAVTIKKPTKNYFTVVIDAGHGGKDPGAVGVKGATEKDVVLAIAKQLAFLINQQPNMRAALTRNGDYFVPLRDRLKLARKGKADLFIAIHADSYFNKSATGVSIYALSQRGATSEAARWIAKRENYSELGGVDLGELQDQSYLLRSVLIDLAQTATITDSLRLGTAMLGSLDQVTDLHYSRVEQAPFVVLKSPDIPSVLVETGFISNPKEELRLSSQEYQNKVANALFNGIRTYLKKYSPAG
jgi:N-acetylmuramoyl-L-alanine amidase